MRFALKNVYKNRSMPRYFLELSYRGSRFNGWQSQTGGGSVQQEVERALSVILADRTAVVGAGRTDSGVHASFYVLHFDTDRIATVEGPDFIYHLDSILCHDVSALRIYRVADDAHARFDAVARQYRYYICSRKNPFLQGIATYWRGDLDIALMNEAAALLLRTEHFASFAKTGSDNKTDICRVTEARWRRAGDISVFTITADRFLRNMVRSIVGTLIDVGRGKITVERFGDIIEGRDRRLAGTSAPAEGLYLNDIRYDTHKIGI